MKGLKRVFLVVVLVFCMVAGSMPLHTVWGTQDVVQAATIKISKKSLEMKVGEVKTLKVSGTKKKVKWSSSDKYVVSVNAKGKVKAVGTGSAYVKAKVGNKSFSCYVKVTSSFNANTVKKNISYTLQDTGDGVVAILKNNNKIVVSLTAKLVYYKNGKMLDSTSDWNYAFEPGKECALFFSAPYDSNYNNVAYDDYKISFTVEEANNTLADVGGISVKSNVGADNVTAEVTQKSDEKFEFVKVACVMYDAAGKAIGYDSAYAECKAQGDVDYLTFDFPYDSNYDTIYPSDYKIYVNGAYTYTWLK